MNMYSILGFLLSLVILAAGTLMSTKNLSIFIDLHAFLLVFGGTLAAMAISFQLDRLFNLFKIFIQRMMKSKRTKYSEIVKETMRIAEAYRKGDSLEALAAKTSDPFMKEALILLNDDVFTEHELFDVLTERAEHMNYIYMEDAGKVKAAGKYPPAFGLMGTSMGMVVLLSNLSGSDALKSVGPAMGLCLTATLYGITFANFVLIPIGENLVDASKEVYQKNLLVIEGVRLIHSKSNPIVVAERLNSFLLPNDRLDWKAMAR